MAWWSSVFEGLLSALLRITEASSGTILVGGHLAQTRLAASWQCEIPFLYGKIVEKQGILWHGRLWEMWGIA